jgi:competence ComEA-like helix-hairpin-helix protein
LLSLSSPILAKKKPPEHLININTASAAELEEVPGIGQATAKKILDKRKSYGSFKSVDDLLAIKGIGPKRLDKMRKYLTVGKAPAKKPSTSPERASTPPKPPMQKTPAKQKPARPPAAIEDQEQRIVRLGQTGSCNRKVSDRPPGRHET